MQPFRLRVQDTGYLPNRECAGARGTSYIEDAERRLLEGHIDMLVSVDKLQVGWDFPELNTVLQLRATTSPAIVIQQAGRAARKMHTKEFAYIIEPRWRADIGNGVGGGGTGGSTKKGNKKVTTPPPPQKYYATPLTLAEALHISGEEDIDSACERVDGRKLSFDIIRSLNDDGMIELGGVRCVYLEMFAKVQDCSYEHIIQEVQKTQIQTVGYALFQKQFVPVYRLNDVLALQIVQDNSMKRKLTTAYGVLLEGQNFCTIETFALFHGLPIPELLKAINHTKIGSISRTIAEEHFTLYPLRRLEALPYVQHHSSLHEVPQGLSDVVVKGVPGIIARNYARNHGLDSEYLERICRESLLTIGYAINIGEPVPIYSKIEVEALPFVREWLRFGPLPLIDEHTGLASLKNGRTGLSLIQFALLHPTVEYQRLVQEIMKTGLQPVGLARHALREATAEKVYMKDQVETLTYVSECLLHENNPRVTSCQFE